jgi:hypothetical protein
MQVMHTAAAFEATSDSSWRISREGTVVAAVDVRHEGVEVVVLAGPTDGPTAPKPYRFPTLQAADHFLTDLMATFAYLGCEVAEN